MSTDGNTNEEPEPKASTKANASPDLTIFDNLGEAYSGEGRSQLTNAQKDGFSEPLALAAGIPRENIDIRALNDSKQVTRAPAESTWARVQSNVEMLDWVFVGRCTGEVGEYPSIFSSVAKKAQILAGVSVLVGAQPTWHVIGMCYDAEVSETAKKIAERLGYDFKSAEIVKVRDRRNLTKNLSDYDDPLSSDVFLTASARFEMVPEIMRKKCVAIQGPPGTGKTVIGKSISLEIAGEESRVLSLQFHQSYSYEDFVRGWRPSDSGDLVLKDGTFLQFCKRAEEDPGNPYVVFIDEINRANVSQVFGEVLSLIEVTKRDVKFAVDLAYSHEEGDSGFYVPKNVFLIATMNTADRSLAIVDYALRRRFSFIDLEPAYGEDEFLNFVSENGVNRTIAEEISARMIELNKVISEDTRNLGPGFAIGHSYFCGKVQEGTDIGRWYMNIVEHEIAPLLREYWSEEDDMAEERIFLLSQELPSPSSTGEQTS